MKTETILVERQDVIEENLANQKTVQFGKGNKNVTVTELVLELKRVRDEAIDYNVPTQRVQALVHRGLPEGDPRENDLLIKLDHQNGKGVKYYPMTNWAHGQLAEKCGIPKKFYETLNTREHRHLLARTVNEFVQTKETRMFRTLSGTIRAIVSDKFLRLDNYDVAESFLEGIMSHGLTDQNIQACSITDTHMHIRATIPYLTEEIRKGDTVVQGMMITNSEVGASSFKCEPFLLRLLCNNGLIGPRAITRIHLGSKAQQGEFQFSDGVQTMERDLVIKQVGEMVEKTFDQGEFERWMAEIKGTTEVQIPSITEAVNQLTTRYNLKQHKDNIIDRLAAQADPTQYGMINALTDYAKDMTTFEKQIDIERIAGDISIMNENEFTSKIAIEV